MQAGKYLYRINGEMRQYLPWASLPGRRTGENEEGQAPMNAFFVASPDDGNLSTLVVNGHELS
jgi:hypothetical protein